MSSQSTISVLVVDDDESFASLTETYLDSLLSDVSIVVETDSTVVISKHIEDAENQFDCIVCDFDMPQKNGLDVLEEVREVTEVPFILFTGRGSEDVASEAFSLGASDYLQKGGSKSHFTILANRVKNYAENYQIRLSKQEDWHKKSQFLDRIDDGYFSINDSYEFTHLNEEGLRLLSVGAGTQLSYDDVIGESLWDIVIDEYGEDYRELYTDALENEVEETFEHYYDEKNICIEVRLFPSEDGLSIFAYDITEKRQAEHQKETERELLMDLYQIAADTSCSSEERVKKALEYGREYLDVALAFVTKITDTEQQIVVSNNRTYNEDLSPGSVCPLGQAYCQSVVETDDMVATTNASESPVISTDAYNTFEIETYISEKISIEGELYGTVCFADKDTRTEFTERQTSIVDLITAWISYEIERDLNKQKLNVQKNELQTQNKKLDAFVGYVSHDLRNPLSIAMGFLEIEREKNDSEYLQKIHKAHKRMDSMISELLELSRSSDSLSDMQQNSLRVLAEDAWSNVQTKDSELVIETDCMIESDSNKLLNVFENFFRNAVEHNQDAVTVTVGESSNGFYIEDDGVGIDDEVDLFKSIEKDVLDSGIGLLVSNEIVKAHGWELQHISCETGARFEFVTQ